MASPVVDTPTPDQSTAEQESVNFDISGNYSDADVTDSLTYSVLGLPAGTGLSMNPTTGVLSGTPTAADTAASPISVTVRATDDSGDVASISFQLSTTAPPADFDPNVIYKQDGSADPDNPGVPVFTSLAAAVGSMSPGDVCEIQSDTPGGTVFISEGLVLPSSGTAADKMRIQVRTGDTCHLYQVDGDCLEGTGRSHWQFHNIIFGRDRMINGWTYASEGDNVEHTRTMDFTSCTHFLFTDCTFNGGRTYDSGMIRASCNNMLWHNCTFQFTKSRDRGNAVTGLGNRLCFVNCTARLNGHDGFSLEGKYCVVIDCRMDGDWTAFAAGDYQRPFGMEGSKQGAPEYGHCLLQGNVIQNGVVSGSSGESSFIKFISHRGICAGNYFVNFDENVIGNTPGHNTALPSGEYSVLHNTFYDIGSVWNTSDLRLNNQGISPLDTGFQNQAFGNNIFAEVGNLNASGTTNAHFRARYTNVGRSDSDGPDFANALRGIEIFGNLIDMASGSGELDLNFNDGVATVSGTLLSLEGTYPSNLHDNANGSPTFVAVGDRLSSDIAAVKAGLALASGSDGEGSAEAVATVSTTDSSTTTVDVSDAKRFVALRDSNHHNLDYFDTYLPRHYVRIGSNAIVEVTAVDYANDQITIASAQNVTSGDDIFWASATEVWDNVGAAQ